MDNIIVEIPCIGEMKNGVYGDPANCYLATAIKKLGHTNVSVGGAGRTKINGVSHKPKKNSFNYKVVLEAFKEQKTLIVELIPN